MQLIVDLKGSHFKLLIVDHRIIMANCACSCVLLCGNVPTQQYILPLTETVASGDTQLHSQLFQSRFFATCHNNCGNIYLVLVSECEALHYYIKELCKNGFQSLHFRIDFPFSCNQSKFCMAQTVVYCVNLYY